MISPIAQNVAFHHSLISRKSSSMTGRTVSTKSNTRLIPQSKKSLILVPNFASVLSRESWRFESRPASVFDIPSMSHPYCRSICPRSAGMTSLARSLPSAAIFWSSAVLFPIALDSSSHPPIPFSASWFTSSAESFPFVRICPIARMTLLSFSWISAHHTALTAFPIAWIAGMTCFALNPNAMSF